MERQEKIRLSLKIVLGGLALAVVLHVFLAGFVLKSGYPSNSFLFRPGLVFSDFYESFDNGNRNPYMGGAPNGRPQFAMFPRLPSNYPPFAHAPIWCLVPFGKNLAFFIYLALCVGFVFCTSARELREASLWRTAFNAAGIALASYPFVFLLHRGNFEIFNYIFVYLFAYFYGRGKWTASSLWLGVACAFKPFALPFFALFLSKDRFKAGIVGVLSIVFLSLGSFALMQGGIAENFRAMADNGAAYAVLYVKGPEGIGFGHTAFGFLRVLGGIISGAMPGPASPLFLKTYMVLALCAGGVLAWYALKARQLWQALLLLASASTLLPYVSMDYRLILFLIPLLLFLNSAEKTRHDAVYCILFSLLLIPTSYWYFWNSEISSSVLINPLLMAALCAVAIRDIIVSGRTEAYAQ